jgi:gas vesicle protein
VRRLRFALIGAALAYFFDPDNGKSRRKAAIKRLGELRSERGGLADDLVGQTRGVQEPSPAQD